MAYESSYLAIFEHKTGKVAHSEKICDSLISCIVSDEVEPKVVMGTVDGDLIVYNYKTKEV